MSGLDALRTWHRVLLLAVATLAAFALALAGQPSVPRTVVALAAWVVSLVITTVWLVRWDRRHGKHLSALLGAGFATGVLWGGFFHAIQAHQALAFFRIFAAASGWLAAGAAAAALLLGVYLMHVLFEGR